MLQDLKKGRQTEIEFLNEAIIKYAKEFNIVIPINETLVSLILGRVNAITEGIIYNV